MRDTTAPAISSLTASPAVITKANNKMVAVTVNAAAADAVGVAATRIVSVTGSEDVAGDWRVTGALTLEVRAERATKASRVYTVTVESRDAAGNASIRSVTVTVR